MIKVRGIEMAFDVTDADMLEKYENGLEIVKQSATLSPLEGEKLSESIRRACHIVFDFFDLLCGEGTALKLFKGKCSLNDCLDAFEEFVDQVRAESEKFSIRVNKYSSNRAQRRSKS